MKKRDLLNFIDKAIEVEDKMAEHMADNVASALQWYECTEPERRNIKAMLSMISSESRSHSQTLSALRLKIENDGKEEY
ncbi:MAG: hypothetical protein JXA24_06370 [Proteobacteria bacterium]|nr:hypothetical protein [Pseudomonadota bacterium]